MTSTFSTGSSGAHVRHGTSILSLCIFAILCTTLYQPAASAQTNNPVLSATSFPVTGKKWTLAFYFAGDNSLEKDQIKNLRELCNGASALKDTNIVALVDRDDDIRRENIFTAWKGSRVFIIDGEFREVIKKPVVIPVPVSIEAQRFENIITSLKEESGKKLLDESYRRNNGRYVLREMDKSVKEHLHNVLVDEAGYLLPLNGTAYANLNAAQAETLTAYMSFIKDNFISDHYALFIAGHGNGWFVEDNTAPVSGPKHSAEYYKDIEVPMIKDALMHNSVDVLILDICFMGDIETAWALRDTSRHLVFSQTSLPSMGLDYADLLHGLATIASLTPEIVAFETVESYRRTYGEKVYPVCVSALELDEDFRSFVYLLQAAAKDPYKLPALKTAAKDASYTPSRSSNRNKMADLISLVANLQSEPQSGFTDNFPFIHNHFSVNTEVKGISIYLPTNADLYKQDCETYLKTDFARDFPDGWIKVLPKLIH